MIKTDFTYSNRINLDIKDLRFAVRLIVDPVFDEFILNIKKK